MSPTPSHGPGELAGQIAIVTGGGTGDWSRYRPGVRHRGSGGGRDGALGRAISHHGDRHTRTGGTGDCCASRRDGLPCRAAPGSRNGATIRPSGSAGEQCGEQQCSRPHLGSRPGGLVARCHRESARDAALYACHLAGDASPSPGPNHQRGESLRHQHRAGDYAIAPSV